MRFDEDKKYHTFKQKTEVKSQHYQHQHTRNTQSKHTLRMCQRQQDQKLYITCAKTNEKKRSKAHHTWTCYVKANQQKNVTQQPGTSAKPQRNTAKHITRMPTRQTLWYFAAVVTHLRTVTENPETVSLDHPLQHPPNTPFLLAVSLDHPPQHPPQYSISIGWREKKPTPHKHRLFRQYLYAVGSFPLNDLEVN